MQKSIHTDTDSLVINIFLKSIKQIKKSLLPSIVKLKLLLVWFSYRVGNNLNCLRHTDSFLPQSGCCPVQSLIVSACPVTTGIFSTRPFSHQSHLVWFLRKDVMSVQLSNDIQNWWAPHSFQLDPRWSRNSGSANSSPKLRQSPWQRDMQTGNRKFGKTVTPANWHRERQRLDVSHRISLPALLQHRAFQTGTHLRLKSQSVWNSGWKDGSILSKLSTH